MLFPKRLERGTVAELMVTARFCSEDCAIRERRRRFGNRSQAHKRGLVFNKTASTLRRTPVIAADRAAMPSMPTGRLTRPVQEFDPGPVA